MTSAGGSAISRESETERDGGKLRLLREVVPVFCSRSRSEMKSEEEGKKLFIEEDGKGGTISGTRGPLFLTTTDLAREMSKIPSLSLYLPSNLSKMSVFIGRQLIKSTLSLSLFLSLLTPS